MKSLFWIRLGNDQGLGRTLPVRLVDANGIREELGSSGTHRHG